MSFVVPTIFTAVDRFTPPMQKMMRTNRSFAFQTEVMAARADRAFRRLEAPIRGLNSRLGGFGVTLGAAFIGREIFRTVADFETGLVGVGKTTGLAGRELKALGRGVIELSKGLKVVSNEKLLEFAQSAGQLGITGSDNILRFSKVMAQLETATDIVGDEGAAKIARMLTITKEGVGVVDRFGSVLVELGNTSAATESEILELASEVGRGVAQFGILSKDILGMSAALKSLDVRPEAAGTAIGKTFRELEAAMRGRGIRRFADIMGVSGQEAKSIFARDKVKAFEMFISGLGRMNKEGQSVSMMLDKIGLGGDRTIKVLAPLAINSELLTQKLKASNAEWERNEALNKEFITASRTLNNALKSITIGFSNFLNEAANTNSTTSLGILRDILFAIGRNMGTIVPAIGLLIGAWAAMRVALFLTKTALGVYDFALGVTGALHGTLTRSIALNTASLAGYRIATGLATAAQWALNVAMSANPITLIITAITALGTATYFLATRWDEWGAAVGGMLALLGGPVWVVIVGTISLVKSFMRNWDELIEMFKAGEILGAFKLIASIIIDSLLMPLQQVFELVAKWTGFDWAANITSDIENLRAELGVSTEPVNPEAERQDALERTLTRTENARVTIDNRTGFPVVTDEPSLVAINTTPTFGR